MEAKGYEISHEELLERMYDESFVRAGLIRWLAGKDIFHFTDPQLADALNKNLCDSIPDPKEPLEKWMSAAQACAEEDIAEKLREMSRRKKVPFHYTGKKVRVGIAAERRHRPDRGEANTCQKDDDLRGEESPTDESPQSKAANQGSGLKPLPMPAPRQVS